MKVNFKKLKNGVNILSHNVPNSKIFNLNIVIKFGIRDQNHTEVEFVHLMEHLMMNGSKSYPKPEDTAIILETAGSYLNAHVNTEGLTLTGESLIDCWEDMVDIMFDKLSLPNITHDIINKELRTLNNEYEAQINNVEKFLEKSLILLLFPESSLVLNPRLDEYPLKKVDMSELEIFHKKIFDPELISFVCVGDLKKMDIINKISAFFLKLKNTDYRPSRIKPQLGNIKSIDLESALIKKVTHLRFGFATVERDSKLVAVFDIINSYLGRGYRSKLFTELRLKHNLIYSHISKSIYFSDVGFLYFGFSTTQPKEAEQVIRDSLEKWLSSINEDDLVKLKIKIVNSAKFSVFSSQKNVANIYSNVLVLTGKVETLEDYIDKIEQVTLDDIRRACAILSLDKMYTLRY